MSMKQGWTSWRLVGWKSVGTAVCILTLVSQFVTAEGELAERTEASADIQRNTGVVPDLDLRTKPQVMWKYTATGSNFADVVAFDGTVIALDRTVKALLLECSLLPPYAAAVQSAVQVPVFDYITMANHVFHAVVKQPYAGFM